MCISHVKSKYSSYSCLRRSYYHAFKESTPCCTFLISRIQETASKHIYSNHKQTISSWKKQIRWSASSYSQYFSSTASDFKLDIPEEFNFSYDVIDKQGSDHPEKVAMLWVGQQGQERKITFAKLSQRSSQAATFFTHLGIKKGDRLLVILPRIPAWWESLLGLIKLGAIPIPCTSLLTEKDILFRINTAEVSGLIVDKITLNKIQNIPSLQSIRHKILVAEEEIQGWCAYSHMENFSPLYQGKKTKSSDLCLMYFTSGTEGMPKMVCHTQYYPIEHRSTALWLDHQKEDMHWNLSDGGWAKAAWGFFSAWSSGVTLFVHDTRDQFSPIDTLRTLHTYPITTFCAAPTIYRSLVLKKSLEYLKSHPPSHLRHCVGAGEPLNPIVIETWKKATNLTICDGYGQTETTLLCANFPFNKVKLGSMGKPSPGVDLEIIDEEGMPLLAGQEGHIAMRIHPNRSIGLFQGYWRNPQATAACMKGDWYYTGDRAYKDDEGYYWFLGRGDDIIKSSAYRISPFEVENTLKSHPAVAESAAVAKPDALRGEIVVAFVVLASGYSASATLALELKNHHRKETAPYKSPRQIIFVDELPKTTSGKIKRAELRKSLNLHVHAY